MLVSIHLKIHWGLKNAHDGAQFEGDIPEPPPIQDAPLTSNFQHMMNEEELTSAQQAYQSAGQEESDGRQQKKKRFADIELTEDDVSRPRFVRESTTPHTTSEYFAKQAKRANKTGVPLIEPEEDPQDLPVEATQSK